MKKSVSKLSEIYNLLDQDYSQRNIIPLQNVTAFQVTTLGSMPLINATQSNLPTKQNRLVCINCGYNGHTVDTCYKIHGYPTGFNAKNNGYTKPFLLK